MGAMTDLAQGIRCDPHTYQAPAHLLTCGTGGETGRVWCISRSEAICHLIFVLCGSFVVQSIKSQWNTSNSPEPDIRPSQHNAMFMHVHAMFG